MSLMDMANISLSLCEYSPLLGTRETVLHKTFFTDSSGRLMKTVLEMISTLRTGKGLWSIEASFCHVSFLSFCSTRRKKLSQGWIVSVFCRRSSSKFRLYRSWDFSALIVSTELLSQAIYSICDLGQSVSCIQLMGERKWWVVVVWIVREQKVQVT